MKSEERHRLETNWLASHLPVWGEKIRPYSSAIVTGVVVVVALLALISMWNARTAKRDRAAWDEFQLAIIQGDNEYDGVRRAAIDESLQGSPMQEWAHVTWADRQLRLAAGAFLIDREGAKKRLEAIAGIYDQLADIASSPDVRNRARLGSARVSEMLGRLDEAREYYAAVEGPLAAVAEARLVELEESGDDIEDVYQWLLTTDLPTPSMPTGGGLPGERPTFDAFPPTADSETNGEFDPFDPAESMEAILGDADDAGRYSDEPATAAGEVSADGDSSGDATSTEADGVGAINGSAAAGEGADVDASDASANGSEQPAADRADQ